jgi:glycosyltransferase involved in cell wall biosynthesis
VKTQVKKMKVLFLLNGLTHYFNKVLNRLNSLEEFEIVTLVPSKENKSLGTGVYTTSEDVEFKVYTLPEKKRFYGKLFFKGFGDVLRKENPNAVVIIWPYILELVFNPFLLREIRKRKIKIFYKDIPFQLVKFKDGLLMKHPGKWVEDKGFVNPNIPDRINLFFLTFLRKLIYKVVDVNVDYIDDAFELLQTYGVDTRKIFITYNSPDTDLLLKAAEEAALTEPILPYKYNRIITVGRLVHWKRVDLLIKAVHILCANFDDVELIIIGAGPDENKLKKLSIEIGLSEKVKFVGPIYDPVTLGKYYLSSTLFVQPGMGGLALNEAMCFGKPIICSICDGTEKKLVREGFNGIYFKEGNENDLAEKIKILLSKPDLIQVMSANSLSIIKNEININTVIQGYSNAFNFVSQK